ncbi:Uncharacterised protein [Moraxella lacunata]|mgnify:CR=1 FL=1|uniref:Uncharacterized protein n=1 Tax=Moraxella lacunata TaxID=477 RepID=A0A1V4GW57_MORLA|nr:hypothetical protein [Moraxella lacunata]OPH36670.1 hypothetical protein B5J94_06985 [Moraxella lacunata]STZ00562.1 Uncharacterised protein [Moraxella lacunata]
MPNTKKTDSPSAEAIKANLEELDAKFAHAKEAEKEELKKQADQARVVLMRLQWLVIILLAGGLLWLYLSFTSVVDKVDERLAKMDTVDTRLNDMDDRLFAITPTDSHKKTNKAEASKDAEFLKIELAMTNRLFEQGSYDDTLTALQAIDYQLGQMSGIAPSVKSALSSSIKADIAYIGTLKTQPDAWQAHIIKMRELQAFLRTKQTSTPNAPLNRGDILLHDANMMLSLAIGSANVRDRGLMTSYLQDVRSQLESHITLHGGKIDPESLKKQSEQTIKEDKKDGEAINNTDIKTGQIGQQVALNTIDDALFWVYDLLANSPKNKGLSSVQMLK